jgi:dTDP-4-dehydrorhamnose 3,5-epimerase
MKFTRTEIPEIVLIEPVVHEDERGYFVETYRQDELEDFLGHRVHFAQDNESKSRYGVLRGLHYQTAPSAQTKLVRAIKGKILDIAVDIREGSPTFGKYISVELSEENKRQLFIPRGFAHGFVVLSDEAIFAYKVDNFYAPDCDRGIAFDDPAIGIDWQIDPKDIILASKDKTNPLLKDADLFHYGMFFYELY